MKSFQQGTVRFPKISEAHDLFSPSDFLQSLYQHWKPLSFWPAIESKTVYCLRKVAQKIIIHVTEGSKSKNIPKVPVDGVAAPPGLENTNP